MSRNLNYYRMILRKVSFDGQLFNKELSPEDCDRLKQWLVGFYKKNNHLKDPSSQETPIN
jgi:hypothetical protein